MKKILFTLSVVAGVAFSSNAQQCAVVPSDCIPPTPLDSPGLYPKSADLPCFEKGTVITQQIDFENYSSFQLAAPPAPPVVVDSIEIVTVDLTPTASSNGICWAMGPASPNNRVNGGAVGCLKVSGTIPANVPAGQYKLNIVVKAWAGGLGTALTQTSEDLKLYYWVRVIEAGSACPDLDTTAGKTSEFIAYGSGINDINSNVSAVSVSPNPFGTAANVSFFTETKETYTLKLTNILGAELHSETIVTKNGGTNTVTVENKNYANGVYLISLTNGKSTITKRVVIQQ